MKSIINTKTKNLNLLIPVLIIPMLFFGIQSGYSAGLLIADGGFGGELEIEEHDVNVTINNGIAVTTVEQVFLNKENRIVEALYTFPVPNGASVSNFSMWINGKEMIGEVLEKKRAREIYQSYKQTRRDPGLLEQVDYKTFEMRIFPIAANAKQKVRIVYYQELNFDHDMATYVYPLATVTHANLESRTTNKFAVSFDILSEIPIASMESTSHGNEFIINQVNEKYSQTSLEVQEGDLNRDVVLTYSTKRPHTGFDIIFSKENRDDGYFYMTLTAGEDLEKLDTGMDYVFIMDVSGSMANDRKLQISSDSIMAFINSLDAKDRFELIAFNVRPNPLYGQLNEADILTKEFCENFLNDQKAAGGTKLNPALQTAYKYKADDRVLNVVVLSDGMTEQTEREELRRGILSRPKGTRVFCIGVGNEVNRPLLKEIAEGSGGLAAFISHGDNFERQAQAFRRKLEHPAASDIAITVTGAEIYDIEPKKLPNLYHGAPLRIYGRYKNSGNAEIKISGNLMGHNFERATTVDFPGIDSENPEIERMWASRRIDQLMKDKDNPSQANAAINEIVRLGENYSIVSQYTSFLVLENDAEYKRWKIERKNLNRTTRDRRKQVALNEELKQLRDNQLAQIGPTVPGTETKKSPTNLQLPQTTNQNVVAQPARPVNVAPPTRQRSNNNRSFDFSGPTGGGAIDPITGTIMLISGGTAAATAYKRRKKK